MTAAAAAASGDLPEVPLSLNLKIDLLLDPLEQVVPLVALVVISQWSPRRSDSMHRMTEATAWFKVGYGTLDGGSSSESE